MKPASSSSSASSSVKPPITVIYGNDEAMVKKRAQQVVDDLMPEDAMNFEVVDARADNVEDALRKIDSLRAAVMTLPFFGGGKLVWWKNVNFMDETVMGKSAAIKAALESLLPELRQADGTSLTVVISAGSWSKIKAFTKGVAATKGTRTEIHDLPEVRRGGEMEVVAEIEERLRDAGFNPRPGAAERLLQATGMDSTAWAAEIEKLCCYKGVAPVLRDGGGAGQGGGVSLAKEDVQAIVGGSREVLTWDFCEAVLSGDGRRALAQLSQLLAQQESEVGILILLSGQVRQAALAATLREAGMLRMVQKGSFASVDITPEGMQLLPRKKNGETISTYMIAQIAARTKNRPAAFWHQGVETLFKASRMLTTGQGDKVRTLETAIMAIAG
ncbi:MAG: DNA polymerase III subunit delta [Candidatus Methylacidiphilales bacterium]